MTVSYSKTNPFSLLWAWKGSVWKAVWLELLIYLCQYYTISIIYRSGMSSESQAWFEDVIIVFRGYAERIPVEFLLGFYVTIVVRRWWTQLTAVTFPESLMAFSCEIVAGTESDAVARRRTIARWFILSQALVFRDVSSSVRKRFPTMDYFVKAGLLTEDEHEHYKAVVTPSMKWQLPLNWIQHELDTRLNEPNPPVTAVATIVAMSYKELNRIRDMHMQLYKHDWISLPLVYTQIAALAVYGYFCTTVVGHQFIVAEHAENRLDLYIPFLTIIEFIVYLGWFKVGLALMRPFGEDDDDFNLNYILDRNLRTALSIADEIYTQCPPPGPDPFQQQRYPTLPHTVGSAASGSSRQPKLHVTLKPSDMKKLETVNPPTETRDARLRQF